MHFKDLPVKKPVKKYVVKLSAEERHHLEELIRKGKNPAQLLTKARILLKADVGEAGEGWSDSRIIEALGTNMSMVCRVRKQLVEEGFEAVRSCKQRAMPAVLKIFYGEKRGKADRVGLLRAPRRACAVDIAAVGGEGCRAQYCRQSERQHHRSSSKKNTLKPHLQKQWVIPPKANSEFVASMEDVLEVYKRPHDPDYPLVCVDESSKQLINETRTPIPMKPGQPARYDYERNGTANLFMMFAPLEGW